MPNFKNFSMNYIGSKLKLLKFLESSINSVVSEKNYRFSDLFAGTGIVGRYFKEKGHQVTANDLQYYSYVLNKNYIGNHTDLHFLWLAEIIPEIITSELSDRKSIVLNYLENLPEKKDLSIKTMLQEERCEENLKECTSRMKMQWSAMRFEVK